MKTFVLALTAVAVLTGSALAAELPAHNYTKAPVMPEPVANWTGFYIFGGAGGGLWAADSYEVLNTGGPAVSHEQRFGGSGYFGTVGAGYDWQFNRSWVAGIFADGQFGSIRGSITEPFIAAAGPEKLRTSYAAGVRLGHLVAPNVLSYVNAGYSGSDWSGASFSSLFPAGTRDFLATPSFHRDGFFVGGGVENNLNIFGITAPGWFMKTEYRAAYYDRIALPETFTPVGGPNGLSATFKPLVQTVSTSLVYRFNTGGSVVAADLPARIYTKAPVMREAAANWTGFYLFGGGGGGVWNADSNAVSTGGSLGAFGPAGTVLTLDQRFGGEGWFGTVGAGYDWQFNRTWLAGIFADGQFGSIRGSLSDPTFAGDVDGLEKLRTSYAAGVRLGYLVAPNVLSYVNGGYSGSEWSGMTMSSPALPAFDTTSSFHRNGWFIGGGAENSLNVVGISAPGWFMKTEYRAAFYNRATLATTFLGPGGITGEAVTFKPWVQTISTSLVYRFNWGGPVVAKY